MAQPTTPGSTNSGKSSGTSTSGSNNSVDSRTITPEERARAQDYWTPERMQNAKPMPPIQLDPKDFPGGKPKNDGTGR